MAANTIEKNHLDQLMRHLASEVQKAINESWKAVPSDDDPALCAEGLDVMSMKFDELASGFTVLAERCRDTAGILLEAAGG